MNCPRCGKLAESYFGSYYSCPWCGDIFASSELEGKPIAKLTPEDAAYLRGKADGARAQLSLFEKLVRERMQAKEQAALTATSFEIRTNHWGAHTSLSVLLDDISRWQREI